LRVILCNTDEDPEKEAMYLRQEEVWVTGAAFAPTRETASRISPTSRNFPTALIDRGAEAAAPTPTPWCL
jgi:LacI family transcriptional regulator, fructose operon transcriptional repressor